MRSRQARQNLSNRPNSCRMLSIVMLLLTKCKNFVFRYFNVSFRKLQERSQVLKCNGSLSKNPDIKTPLVAKHEQQLPPKTRHQWRFYLRVPRRTPVTSSLALLRCEVLSIIYYNNLAILVGSRRIYVAKYANKHNRY